MRSCFGFKCQQEAIKYNLVYKSDTDTFFKVGVWKTWNKKKDFFLHLHRVEWVCKRVRELFLTHRPMNLFSYLDNLSLF